MTRDEAINRLHNIMGFDYHYLPADDAEAMDMAIEALEEAERRTGKWINPSGNPEFVNKEFFHDCSVCGYTVMNKSNFCPNCGAKMEGEV